MTDLKAGNLPKNATKTTKEMASTNSTAFRRSPMMIPKLVVTANKALYEW